MHSRVRKGEFCVQIDKKTGKSKIWIYKDKITGKGKGEATVTYDDPPTASSAITWFHGGCPVGVLEVRLTSRAPQARSSWAARSAWSWPSARPPLGVPAALEGAWAGEPPGEGAEGHPGEEEEEDAGEDPTEAWADGTATGSAPTREWFSAFAAGGLEQWFSSIDD